MTTDSAFQIVPRGEVHPSPLNPRKTFDPVKLQELAGSMADGKGIIEPLVVRPTTVKNKTGYELIAGERRWRASELAGLTEVPIVIKSLQDHEVLELMLIENKQRAELGPLEEAESYKQLMALTGYDVDEVAHKIGMSQKYVYDRVKLLQLVPEAKQLLLDARITAGHAILIARLKPEDQARVIEPSNYDIWKRESVLKFDDDEFDDDDSSHQGKKVCTVRELEHWIADHVRFDPSLPVNADLFPDTVLAVAEAEQKPGRGKKVIHITHEYRAHDDIRKDDSGERVYGPQSWRLADGSAKDAPTCEHSVLGLIVAGPGQGTALTVCIRRDKCKAHFGKELREKQKVAKATGGGKKSSWREQQEREEQRRQAEREKEEREVAAFNLARPALRSAVFAAIKKIAMPAAEKLLTSDRAAKDLTAMLPGRNGEAVVRRLLAAAVLQHFDANYIYGIRRALQDIAALGIDSAAIVKAANAPSGDTKAAPATKADKAVSKKPATKKATKKKGAAKR